MTKQEAIQEQIDEVMDTFDFATVRKIMAALDWKWATSEGMNREIPDEYEIRRSARNRMRDAAKVGYSSSGGFSARLIEGVEDEKAWLLMDLNFGIQSFQDTTDYVQ
jgi:hypothetical protein